MRPVLYSILFVMISSVAVAQNSTSSSSSSSGIRGWGPRVGLGVDPDQFLVGVHFDAGRFAPDVRFQPDIELGLDDDFFVLSFTAPVHHRFPTNGDIRPYAGGGFQLGYISSDRFDDEIEFSINLIGGVEWARNNGGLFFLEASLMAGDLHDFKILAGWTIR